MVWFVAWWPKMQKSVQNQGKKTPPPGRDLARASRSGGGAGGQTGATLFALNLSVFGDYGRCSGRYRGRGGPNHGDSVRDDSRASDDFCSSRGHENRC